MKPPEPVLQELPPEVRSEVEAPSPARRAVGIALRVAGLVLLCLVLAKVPWRDRAFLADGSVVRGRLEQPWRAGSPASIDTEWSLWDRGPHREGTRVVPPGDLLVRERGLPPVEEGVLALAGRLEALPALAVLAIAGLSVLAAALRWRMLLRAQGVAVPVGEACSLTFLGNFLNQVLPGGIVGGDVLKAVYAARGRERAAPAVVTVFVDRVLGLFGTVVLACAALLPRWGDPRFHGHALLAYGVLAAGLVVGALVLSRRVRAATGIEGRVARIPFAGAFLAEADRAVLSFRERKGPVVAALGISVLIHVGWCGANAVLGGMLGIDLPLSAWFAVIPPILVVSAIPLLPGGWGVGEAAFAFFLGLVGVPPAPAVAVSVLGRVVQMLWALPGGIVLLARRA